MSRTDKDEPFWVWAELWYPEHSRNCEVYMRQGGFGFPKKEPIRACNLPEEPKRSLFRCANRMRSVDCRWVPDVKWYSYDKINKKPPYWWISPPKWVVDSRYNNPCRRDVRDSLIEAKKDYNSNGETEIECWYPSARNSVKWLWY